MFKIIKLLEKVNRVGVWAGGILLFLITLLIAVEVVLRKVFSISLGGADELSSYVLAISTSWAFGYTLLKKAHIRIDIFYTKLPGKIRIVFDIASQIIFLLYLVPLVYFASIVLQTSWIRHSTANTPLQTPLWIPQCLWLLGLVLFLVTVVAMLLATCSSLIQKDLSKALQLAGPNTLEEEIMEGSGISLNTKEGDK